LHIGEETTLFLPERPLVLLSPFFKRAPEMWFDVRKDASSVLVREKKEEKSLRSIEPELGPWKTLA